ncbi:MAG: T9SS type A sorting domain-containing protein [Chitinophagales bacterium]
MKKIVLVLVALAFGNPGFSQQAGLPDNTFNGNGRVISSINVGPDVARGVVLLPSGDFLVAGGTNSAITGNDFFCAKFNSTGQPDLTFGQSGVITTDVQLGSDDYAYSIAAEASGKFYIAGYSNDGTVKKAAIIRYLANGTIDSAFGVNGRSLTTFINGNSDEIKKIKVHALSGKLIVCGTSQVNTNISRPIVARFLSDGNLDTSFNHTGIRNVALTTADQSKLFGAEDVTVEPSGRITVIGWRDDTGFIRDKEFWAGRLTSNGNFDNTFSTDGVGTYEGAAISGTSYYDNAGYSMYLDPSGNVLIAGLQGYQNSLNIERRAFSVIKVDNTGTLANWGFQSIFDESEHNVFNVIRPDNNGNFVMAGAVTDYNNSYTDIGIERINATPDLDPTFGPSGSGAIREYFGNLNQVAAYDMVIQNDNKVVLVGQADNNFFIARYTGIAIPQLDSFHLIAPTNDTTILDNSQIDFSWSIAPGATKYLFVIDTSTAFGSYADSTFTQYTDHPEYALPLGQTWYWKVKAFNGNTSGAWKGPWRFNTFTIPAITLVSPANGAINVPTVNTYFSWNGSSYLDGYEIQVDSFPGFSSPITYSQTNTSVTSPYILPYNKTFYWHVRGFKTSTGNIGPWSQTYSFRTGFAAGLETVTGGEIHLRPLTADQFLVEGIPSGKIEKPRCYDAEGREVFVSTDGNILDVTTLSSGTYLFTLKINDRTIQQRFIKR